MAHHSSTPAGDNIVVVCEEDKRAINDAVVLPPDDIRRLALTSPKRENWENRFLILSFYPDFTRTFPRICLNFYLLNFYFVKEKGDSNKINTIASQLGMEDQKNIIYGVDLY